MESKNNTKKVSDVAERRDIDIFPTRKKEKDPIVVQVVKQEERKRRAEKGNYVGLIVLAVVCASLCYMFSVAILTYGAGQ